MSQPSPEETVRRATAAFNAGSRDEARKVCEQGLRRAPGDPMLSHLLAAVLFSQGEIAAARGHLETSLANRPGNAAAHLLAALTARAAGDFDSALAHLDRAIAIAPRGRTRMPIAGPPRPAAHAMRASISGSAYFRWGDRVEAASDEEHPACEGGSGGDEGSRGRCSTIWNAYPNLTTVCERVPRQLRLGLVQELVTVLV